MTKKTGTTKKSPATPVLSAFTHASYVYTGEMIRKKDGRKLEPADVSAVEDGAIVFDQKKIHWIGPARELPKIYKSVKATDLKRKQAIMPGLIDSHTHLVFAGSRAQEFARRCAGATYQEIADEGGGILTTVNATREASEAELFELALKRALIAYRYGIRTIECKSGYGLDHDAEMKCLKVVKHLREALPQMTFVSTYLGAHAFPKDRRRTEYIDEMVRKTIPEVAEKSLAEFCDVFIDEGYYSIEEGERVLRAAKKAGIKTKVHADELANTESAHLAAKLGANSADHLLKISDYGVESLAESSTVATLLPGTALYLKENFAPARDLLDKGAKVAIATDFNPGTCYSLNLPLMMNLSALYMKMNSAEIFAGVTYSAACALGLEATKGTLDVGMDSDFVVLPYDCFEEMYYRLGW
ncbi:MAG: imidazolonepropionase [Bdellovibrionales bacterium]|nr:imidazolonepropionase [Bdellovibrionales bacterium]